MRGEDEGGVRAAEPEGVRKYVLRFYRPRLVRHVVEVALRIGRLVVDRRWQDAVLDDQRADRCFQSAGRAEKVARHRLGGADGELVSLIAKNRLDRDRFD